MRKQNLKFTSQESPFGFDQVPFYLIGLGQSFGSTTSSKNVKVWIINCFCYLVHALMPPLQCLLVFKTIAVSVQLHLVQKWAKLTPYYGTLRLGTEIEPIGWIFDTRKSNQFPVHGTNEQINSLKEHYRLFGKIMKKKSIRQMKISSQIQISWYHSFVDMFLSKVVISYMSWKIG